MFIIEKIKKVPKVSSSRLLVENLPNEVNHHQIIV